MDSFAYAHEVNIRRFRNLLETAIDEAERRTLRRLLAEEMAKSGVIVAEPEKK